MRFDFDSYDYHYVMHCSTAEQAEVFCRYLDSIGKTWSGSMHRSYLETNHYDTYQDQTCYRFALGVYCDLDFYKKRGVNILEFSDFDWDELPINSNSKMSEISFEEMFYGAVSDKTSV